MLDLPFLGNIFQVEISSPYKPQLLETTSFNMSKLEPDTQVCRRITAWNAKRGALIVVS